MSPYAFLIHTGIAMLLVQDAASQLNTVTKVATRIYEESEGSEATVVVATVRLTEGNAYVVAYREGKFIANNIVRLSRVHAPEPIYLELVQGDDSAEHGGTITIQ